MTITRRKGQWINTLNNYRMKLSITWESLVKMDRKDIKGMVREYDTNLWLEGLENKISLRWYLLGKQQIAYEHCYKNNKQSAFLAKARINSLQLKVHLGSVIPDYDRKCKLCGEEDEDLEHFLVKCKELENARDRDIMSGPETSPQEKTIEILFRNGNHQKTAEMIRKMWLLRKRRGDDLRQP